jgi:cytochrome c biogenesis protein CcmG/thiol:disulfide interchange protein DsbE
MNDNQQTDNTNEKRASLPLWAQWIVWIGLIGLLIVVGIQLVVTQKGTVKPGEKAPDFTLVSYEGDIYSPQEMSGKIVLINLWASWCNPCAQEAPDLQAAWEKYESRDDVLFLGVAYSDMDDPAKEYIESFNITYPNGPDIGTKIYDTFRATGVPETYIIDRDGFLSYVKVGPFNSVQEITNMVDSLLQK